MNALEYNGSEGEKLASKSKWINLPKGEPINLSLFWEMVGNEITQIDLDIIISRRPV